MLTTSKFKVAVMWHFNYAELEPETQSKPESQPKTLTLFTFYFLFFYLFIFCATLQALLFPSGNANLHPKIIPLSVPCRVCLITIHS